MSVSNIWHVLSSMHFLVLQVHTFMMWAVFAHMQKFFLSAFCVMLVLLAPYYTMHAHCSACGISYAIRLIAFVGGIAAGSALQL